jgi:N-formylglutamate amidohydrolase
MSRREVEAIENELSPPFEVARPGEITAPLVFNSPHSGRIHPAHSAAL